MNSTAGTYVVSIMSALCEASQRDGRNYMPTIATGLTKREAYRVAREALTGYGIIEARAYPLDWDDFGGKTYSRPMTDAERADWHRMIARLRAEDSQQDDPANSELHPY
jgi:hypothetical protein